MEILAAIVTIATGICTASVFIYRSYRKKKKDEDSIVNNTLMETWLMQSVDFDASPSVSTVLSINEMNVDFSSISEWQINLRRKLICPFWATNIKTGKLGYVKRVMPLSNNEDDIILQVTCDTNNKFWNAHDLYPIDRLSYNYSLLQDYRNKYSCSIEN
jgi:hypothetical protein